MQKIVVPESAFSAKLLDREYHERLLADLSQIVAKAGVPANAVWSRLSEYCTQDEVDWVRNIRSSEDSGLLFLGSKFVPSVEDKMIAITGVCLRNYTDARVMPLQDVLRVLKEGEMPTPTVLLISNFCLDKSKGGDVPTWDVSMLMGLLLTRSNKGLKTILYSTSMALVQKQYGDAFKALLECKFAIATNEGVSAPMALVSADEGEVE